MYNHAFTIAFSLETNNEGGKVTSDELLKALQERLNDLQKFPEQIIEAVGLPDDTYELPDDTYELPWGTYDTETLV
jgi:hypothetical protein